MRPAHSRVPSPVAVWPVRPSSTSSPAAASSRACVAGQGVQLQGLLPAGVRFAEGHPVGQGLKVGPVEVHLELIAGLGVEARLGVQAVDVGVDVHDEYRAVLAGEDVQSSRYSWPV